jgi:hypothetical protein
MQNEEHLNATTTVDHCDWAIKVHHISLLAIQEIIALCADLY